MEQFRGVRLPRLRLAMAPFVIARSTSDEAISSLKNVVAQFIGQLCLMNQATTKSGGGERCGHCGANLVLAS
jgi:hypothetical protein